MKKGQNKATQILGQVKAEIQICNKENAEVVMRGDVSYNGMTFTNLSILRLVIWFDGESVNVDDSFSLCIPYLKPVKDFRAFMIRALVGELKKTFTGVCHVNNIAEDGMEMYIEELRGFDEIDNVVRQTKASVNQLDSKRDGAKKSALAILKAMGKHAFIDAEFSADIDPADYK